MSSGSTYTGGAGGGTCTTGAGGIDGLTRVGSRLVSSVFTVAELLAVDAEADALAVEDGTVGFLSVSASVFTEFAAGGGRTVAVGVEAAEAPVTPGVPAGEVLAEVFAARFATVFGALALF